MPEHAALKDNVYPAAQPYGPTPAEPAALSAHVRPWVMLGALSLFFLFAYVCAQWVMRTELQKIVVAKESAMLGLMADDEITVQRLSTLAKNEALFVAATPPIQGIGRALAAGGRDPLDGTTQQAWLQRLGAIAQAYVAARPEVFQVRLIGLADQGRELMRVEQNQAGQVRVAPPDALQQKGAHGYFKQALGLAPGQVALSPLDLNVENGQIEMPPRPTLRASVAVRNASNQVFGVVVVNTHAAPLLSNISSTSLAGAVHWVSNAQGHYLVHPQVEQSFAYLLRPQTAKTFGQEFTLRPDGLAELGLVAQAGTQVMRGPGGQEWLMRSSTLLPAQADGQGGLVLHSGIPIKLLQVLAWQDGRAQLLLLWFEGGIVIGLLTFMLLHWRARTGLRSLRGAGLSEEGAAPKPAIALPLLGKQLALPITGNGLLIALSWGVLLPWAWWALLIFVPSTDSISFPFILGLLPVLLASWAGGLAAGLVATGISVVLGFDLATPSTPPLDWRGASLEVFVAAGITMVLGLLITFTQESVRRQGWRLTQANSRLARTVEATQLGFWEYELTNGRVSWSPEVLAFRGLREGEFDGTLAAAVQYTHPEDRERFAATARDARPNEPYAIEFRVLRPDGQIRWLEARGVLQANASGQPLRFVGTEVDITERKLAEAALRESNARFEALFSQLPDSCLMISLDNFTVADCNRAAERLFGGSHADLVGRSLVELSASTQSGGVDLAEAAQRVVHQTQAEGLLTFEWVHRRLDGETFIAQVSGQLIELGQKPFFIGVQRDVTPLRKAEAALRESEEKFRTAFAEAAIGFVLGDARSGEIVSVNTKLCALLGYTEAELLGRHFMDFVHPDDAMEQAALVRQLRAGEIASFVVENRYLHRDGHPVWARKSVAAIRDHAGSVRWISALSEDITERKAATEKLASEQARLQAVIDASPAVIYVCRVDGDWPATFISANVTQQFGYSPQECLHPGWWVSSLHPEDRDRILAGVAALLEKGHHVHEYRMATKAGDWRWVHDELVLTRDAQGKPLSATGAILDITERKLAEAALRESEAENRKLALAVARTHNAVILTDAEGRIEWVNEGFTRITGYSSAEALGRKPGTFLQGPGTDPKTVRHMSAAIRAGEGFQVELLNYTKAGRSYWLSIEAQPVRDAGGRLTGFLAIETDITERKAAEAELMRTRDVLVQAQQVARLGSFEYFPRTNRLEWSAEEKRIHGLDPDGPSPSFEAVVAMLLPEDRAPTLAHFEQFIRGDGPGAWDYRVVLPDGSVRHMSTQAASEFDQQGELQRVIGTTQDITERKAAEAAPWESRKQLRFLADHAPVRIAHLDDQLRYRFVNQPYALFFGHTPSEILRMHPREVLGETAFLTTEPKMKQALAGEAVEFELFLPDTSLGPSFVLVRYQPERDESDKVVGFISASVDMNERKQAEARLQQLLAERTNLLDEVHHRVKNNLQVVSSLLMLQKGSTQNQEAAEQLQLSRDRVAAIAQVHEQLYRTQNFVQVDFGDYLHELLAGLARSSSASEKNIQLQVLGGKVVLTLGEAVPCALLVNELVSNALKHAFPAGRSGRVWVELALGEDGSRTVWVGDDGVGLAPNADAAAPLGQEQGLGLTLVRRLSAQLQGTLERQVTEVGTLWCLRLGRMMEQVNSVSL